MSDPKMIKEIMEAVTIPVMAKARIGHFVECQVRKPVHSFARKSPFTQSLMLTANCCIRYCKSLELIMWTSPKSSHLRMRLIMWRRMISGYRSFVAAET